MPKRVNDEINVASGNKRRREKVAADVPGASAQEKKDTLPVLDDYVKKNTIESDDEEANEDQADKFERLGEEDIEGAEDSDVGDEFNDDETQQGNAPLITPFNLKEEMEEGDFDKQGHYHFKKDNDIRDNWMDEIDWAKVKKNEKNIPSYASRINEDEDEDKVDFNEIKTLEEILKYLNSGETVQAAMRRLGKLSNSQRSRNWRREKKYDLEDDEMESETKVSDEEKRNKEKLDELSELVDQMAGAGHYDIYTDSYEKIQFKIERKKPAKVVIPDNVDADDALDMFGDDFDEQDSGESKKESKKSDKEAEGSGDASTSKATMWLYKWGKDKTETYGPFPNKHMMQWKEANYFPKEVIVRRTDKTNFYEIGRIDFDLFEDK